MPDRDARRRFGRRERAALLLAADGRCTGCGEPLASDFHADHRQPWACGGRTDVINGQALCPTCNRRKSNTPAVNTTPATGSIQVANAIGTTGVACGREQHEPVRPHDPASAGHSEAPECHQEIR